jgi:hypothetical protein
MPATVQSRSVSAPSAMLIMVPEVWPPFPLPAASLANFGQSVLLSLLNNTGNLHFLAAANVLYRQAAGQHRHVVSTVLAVALAPMMESVVLIGQIQAEALAREFEHDDIVAIIQHAAGQRLEEGVPKECEPPWPADFMFEEAGDPPLLETAHIQWWGEGYSAHLTMESQHGRLEQSISALRAARLRTALWGYLDYLALIGSSFKD